MDVWLPEGAKIEATDAAVRRIEAVLEQGSRWSRATPVFWAQSAPRFYYNVNPQAPAANYAQIMVNTKSVEGYAEACGAVARACGDSWPPKPRSL